jgi:hypothetical protein
LEVVSILEDVGLSMAKGLENVRVLARIIMFDDSTEFGGWV